MAGKSAFSTDYKAIIKDIKSNKLAPVYFLGGEEPYFIDLIRDELENSVLEDMAKEFDQFVVYASDTTTRDVLSMAKGFPMMGRKVVIVKEAQNLKDLDLISNYVQAVQSTTVLVFAYMHKLDARRSYLKDIVNAGGVVFDSVPLYDNNLPTFLNNYVLEHQWSIDEKALNLMVDSIGNDLHRMANEANKLFVSNNEQHVITYDMVAKCIGVSKQYNVFEFRSAIIAHDVLKANKIARYFADNSKQNPIIPILSLLFSTFSNLMLYHYIPNKNDTRTVCEELGCYPNAVRDYALAARNYNAWQVLRILHEIRLTDAAARGVNNASASEGDLLVQLLYHILHDKR